MLQTTHKYFSHKALETMIDIIKADSPCAMAHVISDCYSNIDVCKRDIIFTVQYMRENAGKLGISFDDGYVELI